VSQAEEGAAPYRIVYSGRCRDETRQLLMRAKAKGLFTEVAKAVRDIDTRLRWIPLDFGEPLQDFPNVGIKEHIGALGPLVVKYGVDEARRLVYVTLPFDLLPKSGL
jgi:hypothetical protein